MKVITAVQIRFCRQFAGERVWWNCINW